MNIVKVRYQWSEDGEEEWCELETFTTGETVLCYHCGFAIPVNESAVKLIAPDGDVYMLHSACADNGCLT